MIPDGEASPEAAGNQKRPPTPRAVKFPAGFSELLRFFMPLKRPEDRFRLFKQWMRQWLWEEAHLRTWGIRGPIMISLKPTDSEVSGAIDQWKSRTFDIALATDLRGRFNIWLGQIQAQTNKDRARKAAAARWTKRKKKKPLALPPDFQI